MHSSRRWLDRVRWVRQGIVCKFCENASLITQSWHMLNSLLESFSSQQTNTCSKSVTLKTPKKRCEIRSKLTNKTPEKCNWWCQLWTYFISCSSISIVDFKQGVVYWDCCLLCCTIYMGRPIPLTASKMITFPVCHKYFLWDFVKLQIGKKIWKEKF